VLSDHRGRCAGGARTRPDMESSAVPRWEAGTVGHRRARWCGGWTRERVTGDAGRYLQRIEDRNTVRSADDCLSINSERSGAEARCSVSLSRGGTALKASIDLRNRACTAEPIPGPTGGGVFGA
jgi:hypothetical protein